MIQSPMRCLSLLILFTFFLSCQAEQHEPLQLDKAYPQSLDVSTFFTGRYVFNISEEQVKEMKGEKWFFFVQVEPDQSNQWVSTSIQISIGKKGSEQSRNQRACGTRSGGIDSCFFTNKQFDYKTEEIHANVRCRGPCKFKISAEISQPYKLKPGEDVMMDFENTAYSAVFQLDTTSVTEQFDQLRIVLRPKAFLQFGAPIGLYINKGTSLPTRKNHDFSSLTLWDNGQGVFIDMPDAKGVFTILVEGPEKNVLILENKLISNKESELIDSGLPHFDYLGQGAKKRFKCKVIPQHGLTVKFETFSGAVSLTRILDADMQQIDQQFPALYRSYSEMQYQLSSNFFKQNKQYYNISQYLIFQLQGVQQSTFLFQYYQQSKGILHLVPQLNRYVQIPSKSSSQYYIEMYETDDEQFKKEDIQIVVTNQPGKDVGVRFFRCDREHGANCQLKDNEIGKELYQFQGVKESNDFRRETFQAGVLVYKFSFPAKYFKKVGNDTRRLILGVVISNPSDQQRLYTIRYKNVGHNIYLKQMQVQKDRVSIDQMRYYLYTNRKSDVRQLRVHLVEISGRVKIQGFWEDPRSNDLEGQQVLDFHNMVRFTNIKENQTIYVRVTGKQMAYYSLQVQQLKQRQGQWWNHTQGRRGKFYNEIAIFQDIPYQFTLQPYQRAVYQVHTKNSEFILQMSSILPLDLCMTQDLSKEPFKPNCEVTEKLTKRETETVKMEKGKIGNIGVANNNDKTNKFSIKFYSAEKVEDRTNKTKDDPFSTQTCIFSTLGKVTKTALKPNTSQCYNFMLSSFQDTELSLDLVSHQFDKVNILAMLGQVQKLQIIGQVHIFEKDQIRKACKTLPCPLKLFVQSQVQSQFRFTMQVVTGTIFLLDGIANKFAGPESGARYFAYQLLNKVNTTVILQNRRGSFTFSCLVVQSNDFFSSSTPQLPSPEHNTITSQNPFYFNYQLAVVADNMIKSTYCKQCLLLIAVEKNEHEEGQDGNSRFVIEVTQEDRFLKEKIGSTNYLNKHSMAFYQLENKVNGSILVTLNTQNKQCAHIYAKKGASRPTTSDFDHSSTTNMLLIQNAQAGHYGLSVLANDNCYYSITYTSTSTKIYSTLEPGLFSDIRLDKTQQHSLLYHHTHDKSFRIVALHQTGEIIINVQQYKTIEEYLNSNNDNNITKKKYSWSGRDYVRIDKNDTKYCNDCYYQVALSAQRQTKTSVIVPNDDSQFPITMDSFITEELKKGQTEKMRVYTQHIVQYQINVHYGSVNITLVQGNDELKIISTKIYKANEKTQYQAINNTKDPKGDDFYFMSFTRVIIKAEEDTQFSFGLVSSKDQNKRGNRIRYGAPQFVMLEKGVEECVVGRLDNNEEQFMISITGEKQVDLMNQLEISCKLNDKELLELSKNIAKNEMIVKVDKPPSTTLPANYYFCFKSPESIFFTFIQSSRLSYLPQSNTVMYTGNTNFSFYSQGKSLLQINQCKSRAITTVYSSFSTQNRINSEIRQVRRSNNIVQFLFYGPVYIQVEGQSGTIAWRGKDEAKMTGYGYDQYRPSKIRYEIDGNILSVEIFQLQKNQLQQSKKSVQFSRLGFTAFLAKEQLDLYEAINCENGIFLRQYVESDNTVGKDRKREKIVIKFDVEKVLEKFGKSKYILVGALVNGTSTIQGDGKYRFIYPYQQIPLSLLGVQYEQEQPVPIQPIGPNPRPVPPQPNTQSNGWSFLQYLAIGVVLIFVILILYRTCLKKMLKRRRIQRLSQQGTGDVKYQEFASYSSDRT